MDLPELYKAIINQTTEGIAIADMDGNYLFVNNGYCDMIGYSEQELLKMTVFDVKAKEQPHTSFFESKNDLKNLPIIVRLKRKDGTEFLSEIIGNIITFNDKQYVLGIVRDIVDHQRAELIIQAKNNKLQELNATKDKIFSIIGHDLKSPFNSILGFSDLIIKNIEKYDKEKILTFVKTIHQTASQSFKILENLLDWSRSQIGIKTPVYHLNNLKDILHEIYLLFNEIAKSKNIEIQNNIPDDFFIACDFEMIKTVFRNLISNAIKFTMPGGKVIISAKRQFNFAEICVTDTGIGIEEQTIKSIFNIGHTSKPGTENERGTGLGLVLCKEFIEKHSGEIWIESKPGEGSTFKFTIPLNL